MQIGGFRCFLLDDGLLLEYVRSSELHMYGEVSAFLAEHLDSGDRHHIVCSCAL